VLHFSRARAGLDSSLNSRLVDLEGIAWPKVKSSAKKNSIAGRILQGRKPDDSFFFFLAALQI
jgi:hypothetical protein